MEKFKIIKSKSDYKTALNRLDKILDADPETPEGEEALILSLLIEYYEDAHYPIDSPDPIEAIKIRLHDLGLRQKDLIGIVGSTKGRVSEILNKKRPLTLTVIRKLEGFLRIPAEILIQPYNLVALEAGATSKKEVEKPKHRKRKSTKIVRQKIMLVTEPKSAKYKERE